MSASGVRLGPKGELVVVRAAPPEDPETLRRTVEALRAAPGIAVDVVHVSDDGARVEVSLAYGGRSPEGPMPGAAAAALGAKVAALLSDLHAAGAAHNQPTREHVLVAADGAVRLCGFSAAGPGCGAEDVRALGELLDQLVERGDRSPEAAAVRAIALRARTEDPSARPTASAVAASLASVGAAPRVDASVTSPERRRRPVAAIVGGALVVVAGVGLLAATTAVRGAPGDVDAAASATPAPTTSSTTAASTTVVAERVWPATTTTLAGDGSTWAFGGPRDRVVVGRWACSDEATPALVRDDGTVWVVRAWPSPAQAATEADYVTKVDGDVRDVDVQRDGTCDALFVTTSTTSLRVL